MSVCVANDSNESNHSDSSILGTIRRSIIEALFGLLERMIRALRFHPGTVVGEVRVGVVLWLLRLVYGGWITASKGVVCVCGDDDSLLRAPRTALLITVAVTEL